MIEMDVLRNSEICNERRAIQEIFKMLWDVLALYEPTDAYNNVPEGVSAQDIWIYMDNRLLDVRKELFSFFLQNEEVRTKLMRIIDETEIFVKSYEMPGVVTRWKSINNNLLFFDCAFDLMKESPEFYKKMCRGLTGMKLAVYPDSELIDDCSKYFENMESKIKNNNLRYSEKRVFQNELLTTLTMVFENDFKEMLA